MYSILYTFKASKLLFISAPSNLVCRSEFDVSAPLSLPKIAHCQVVKQFIFMYCTSKYKPCLFNRRTSLEYSAHIIIRSYTI